ncbi:glycosyltransferase family 2 protein [Faecalicatena contorta]|mgnify:CR=1 FL=1|uniref:Glycosyltransferase family 2 protein n=1 Tax=Faecalicatena fissicatena TaxID=290055 RepID=A0ABS2E4F6_9FIRM|nr:MULTISPECIES: glycosyltransferase family 2 protein [Clostridia]MBM6684027.1 glycosyltransferase family 2 protein [Faecalicatena contorta]MBM6711725.1 glycosyltransferase family 2 protein [Faecalicatena contorta]MBM6736537.1 glycosyltransferase family 2 protein [Faecalicatena fissicatena]HIX99772.1 glycosyltransferase [Candidatus Dorea intestinigallinarum]
MKTIHISIIIPVYNGELYFQRCVDSIYRQKEDRYEVILIDDGSTDNFYEKCREYIEGNMKFRLIRQKNRGVGAARNLGISKAQGEWIYFLDIDDELEDGALEEMLQMTDSDIQWLVMNFYKHVVGEKKKAPLALSDYIIGMHSGYDNLPRMLNEELFMYPCAKLYSRQIIVENGLQFPQGIKYGEDIRFNLEYFRYVRNYRVESKPVMTYHIDQGKGAGSAYYKNSFEMQMDIDKKILEMDQTYYHISLNAQKELNHYFFRQGINTAAAYLTVWKSLPFLYRIGQIQEVLSDKRFQTFLERERENGRIKKLDHYLLKKKKFLVYYVIHYMYTKIKAIRKGR